MAVMRETWSDERLDDLNGRVSDGFRRVDEDFREVRGEIRDLHSEMNARFDSMKRTMTQGFIALSAAFVAGFVGLAGLIAL